MDTIFFMGIHSFFTGKRGDYNGKLRLAARLRANVF
jgi:hypothetical protein